ncbi:Tripeptidyl-peptidase SED2 [Pseudocercospora fuligena]|uniref:tripeptidyl-peptidase II n=1 Tax=Pseudocercospora fuligena TaxID=685502 RepID=A0A8H6RR78_9PEZI|nr:Tripeptidyl-peptidase SED2 [Pseudocercospora fuligena]
MLFTQVVLSLSAIGIASGRPSAKRTSYAIKERHIVPRSWTKLGPASKRDTLQLAIGLKQQNEGLIEQHLMEVSDREHERYGQYLSHDEVKAIIAPSNETLEAVQSWLGDHGITDWIHNHAKDMIHCSLSIEQAEALLDTKYHAFKHEDGTEINRAPEWSLPEYLHDHIDIVQPTTSFFHPQKEVKEDGHPWKPMSYWQSQNKPGMYGEFETEKCKNSPGDPKTGGGHQRPVVPGVPQTGAQQGSQASQQAVPQAQPAQAAQGVNPGHKSVGDAVDDNNNMGISLTPDHQSVGDAVDDNMDLSQICEPEFVTPQCIRTLYGTINYKPQVPDRNGMGTANYLNETAHRGDIELFMRAFRPDAAPMANAFKYEVIAGGANRQGVYAQETIIKETNKEANMDATQAISITYPSRFTAWSTGGSPPFQPSTSTPKNTNEPYLTWLNHILGQKDLPSVISTSYGDDEQTVPYSYAKRVCSGLAQLGVRGITVFFSSGDVGVGDEGTCFSNDGKNTPKFLPNFPCSCPWVTTVGSTAGFQPETATSRFASGAGFSNYFSMPTYQKATVSRYLQSLRGANQGLYNPNGRAYPDVSAQGNHDAIVWNGQASTMGGTSASAPTFAGVITLVNDALIAAGKPPLGFINPWLYSSGYRALNDIVQGSSYGCGTQGFPAVQGWDAVSGWGTPNFPRLVQAAMSAAGAATASANSKTPGLQNAAQGGQQ